MPHEHMRIQDGLEERAEAICRMFNVPASVCVTNHSTKGRRFRDVVREPLSGREDSRGTDGTTDNHGSTETEASTHRMGVAQCGERTVSRSTVERIEATRTDGSVDVETRSR